MTEKFELEKLWNTAAVVYFTTKYEDVPGETEKNHQKLKHGSVGV